MMTMDFRGADIVAVIKDHGIRILLPAGVSVAVEGDEITITSEAAS